jgi:MinD-like ATPase involved in chromosome partitioning or flagellar assembly
LANCIAFHSYKGGTGKTTIAANFAASLANRGYHVFLLDLDIYAPSLQSYFEKEPKKWINDFLYSNAELEDVLTDLTPTVIENDKNNSENSRKKNKKSGNGKLWVAFSNSKKEEIYKLEGGTGGGGGAGKQDTSKIQLLRRFILLREHLISQYDADYIIIDTSPGIRYWSINALAVADTLFLTLKMGDLDIEGTRKMADEIYGSFTKFGAKSYLLLNRVAGYCVPNIRDETPMLSPGTVSNDESTLHLRNNGPSGLMQLQQEQTKKDVKNMLSDEVGMNIISAIPCYCDIQFTRKEFLTVLRYPDHPFAKQVEQLIESIREVLQTKV